MSGVQESAQHEQTVSKVQTMSMRDKNVASSRQKAENFGLTEEEKSWTGANRIPKSTPGAEL